MATEKEVLLIDIKVEAGKALQDATAQKKAIQDLKMANADLNTQNKELSKDELTNAAAIKANTQAIILNEAQIKSRTLQLNADMRVLQDTTKGTHEANGAYKLLNDQYRTTNQLAKDLAVAYGSNSKQAKDATTAAKKMSDQLKEVDDSVGQNQRNVGNYGGALGKMQGVMAMVPTSAAGMSGGFTSLLAPMKAVLVQMWAMVANPIGAVIAAVAVVLGGLYLVFKDFKPIVDKVEQALAAVAAVFATVKNVIIGLLTGQKSLKESTEGLGKSMSDAANAAMALKKAQQELEDSQAGLEEQNKRDETQIQKLMLQARNRTLAEKDRIALLEKAQKLSDDIYQRSKKQNDEEVKNAEEALRIKMKLSDSEMKQLKLLGSKYAEKMQDARGAAKEEIATLHEALMGRQDMIQQWVAIQEKAQNRIDQNADAADAKETNRLEKVQADKEKAAENWKAKREKAKDDEIKKMETLLQISQAKEKEITAAGAFATWEAERAIIEKKVKYNKLTEEEATLARLQANNKYRDTINTIANTALENEKKRIDDLLDYEQSYYDIEAEISKAASEKMVKQREEVAKVVAENERAIAEMNGAAIFDYQKEQLRLKMEEELKTEGLTEEQKKLIRERYRQEGIAIDALNTQSKLDNASKFVGALSGIFDQGTVAAKGIASAQIAIDGISGAFSAYKSMVASGLPAPFNFIAGGVAAAGVIASSVSSISKVWAVKKDQRAVSSGVNSSAPSMSVPTSVPSGTQGAGLVNRTSTTTAISQAGGDVTSQIAKGVSQALQANPIQPTLVLQDVTKAQAQQTKLKTDNSL